MDANPTRAYRFAGYHVDLTQRRLSTPSGEPIPLSGRAYDVLVFLIEHRDRVVSKDELLKAVWPRTIVEENNLNQAVSTLRRAFGDSRESPRYILTVAGRGYRFIAPLDEPIDAPAAAAASRAVETLTKTPVLREPETALPGLQAPPPPEAARPRVQSVGRRWALLGLGAAALAGGGLYVMRGRRAESRLPRTIAVLPFKPLVASATDEALQFGVTLTLINRLSDLPGVVVAPLSSVRRYAGVDQDPLAAGRELAVDAVVDGYIQQVSPGQVRSTARLLEVESGRALWAGEGFNERGDLLAIQDRLASSIVSALSINLSGAARERLLRRDTQSISAWQNYMDGRYHLDRRNEADFRRALEFFAAAERDDPRFALASAGVADAWAILGVFGIEPPDLVFPRSQAAAERALAIEPTLPEALGALGHFMVQYRRDMRRGEELYMRALELKPNYVQAMIWMGLLRTMQLRTEDGLRWFEDAQALEPVSLAVSTLIGHVLYYARDFDRSHDQLSRLVSTAPEADLARSFLARTLLIRREPAAALALVEGRNLKVPGAFGNVGRAAAQLGDRLRAGEEVARLESLAARGFGIAYDLALIHLDLGDRESALACVERVVNDDSQMGLYLEADPAFDPLRDEPRFREVARRLATGEL